MGRRKESRIKIKTIVILANEYISIINKYIREDEKLEPILKLINTLTSWY